MKKKTILLTAFVFLATLMSEFAYADSAVIQSEYAKEQAHIQVQLNNARKKLRDLESQRDRAVEGAKNQANVDKDGINAMKKYWTLILNRYASDDGKFESWQQLNQKDVDNINNLFDAYLKSKPLQGRVSAGTADRTLDWGMGRLEEVAKQHGSPKPENNSDVEILTHQIKDSETTISAIQSHADRIGVKLKDQDVADDTTPSDSAASDSNRAPASDTATNSDDRPIVEDR